MISGRQIKIARASLDWSQEDLASRTDLSVTTISNLESCDMSPRPATERAIRSVFEEAGIEFIEHDGVRHRPSDVTSYEGTGSRDRFFENMIETVKNYSGEVVGVFKSPEIFVQSCNVSRGNAEFFNKLMELATVKCLLPRPLQTASFMPPFRFRTITEELIGAESRLIFGDKHAIIIPDGNSSFRFVVISSFSLAQDNRIHFAKLWEKAAPSIIQVEASRVVVTA